MDEKYSRSDQLLSLVPIEAFQEKYSEDIHGNFYFGFPLEPILKAEQDLLSKVVRSAVYFSMEFGLSSNTYNAGDGLLSPNSDWIAKMIHAISEAGFFNTDRMVEEYQKTIWGM